jgi:membrane protein DedA with SNARE-associated domain
METLSLIHKIESLFDQFGYLIVFFSSLIEITPFGWAIPGGLILAVGGFFAYKSQELFIIILISGWLGAWSSLIGGYFLGKKTGMWLIKKLRQEKNAQRAKVMLKKNGAIVLTSSMLANLTRFWSAYVAGTEDYPFSRFITYSGVASLTWVSLMVFVGFLAGSGKGRLETILAKTSIASWLFFIFTILVIIYSIKSGREELENENNQIK